MRAEGDSPAGTSAEGAGLAAQAGGAAQAGASGGARAPEAGRRVFYACKYTPLELLAGFGAQAVPLEAGTDDFAEADRLAHPNLCGYGRGMIERAMAGDVRELVLVTCCDVVKRVYDVLAAQHRIDFLWLLDLPHRRGPAEVRLFRARLAELARAYAAYSGATFDPGRALASLPEASAPGDGRVTLLGAHADAALVDAVRDAMGPGVEVENATCTNRRIDAPAPLGLARAPREGSCDACGADAGGAGGPSDASGGGDALGAFLDWYAPALLGQVPCMRMADARARGELLGAPGQLGVVYHTMKFCDYYGFEYARALEADEGDVPMVKIETDGTRQSSGQLRTRLEAFAETLRTTGGAATPDARGATGARADESEAPVGGTRDGGGAGPYALGVDSGSTSTDAALVNGDGAVVASAIVPTGARATLAAERARDQVLAQAGIAPDQVAYTVATGYGRDAIGYADASVTEITCHARGAHHLDPAARTVIDIGGQDSKVIHLTESGAVSSFVMNDKCAAGTGRFLEMMARTLEVSLDEFCRLGRSWKRDVTISSMCTVFAESEVVSLVAQDTPTPDIVHGLDRSVASKVSSLARRVGAEPPYLMTGGVAANDGVVDALSEALGAPVATNPSSQLCGAIGAALIARDRAGGGRGARG